MTREEMDEAVRIAQRVLPVLERVQRARVAHGRSDDDWNERELFVLARALLAEAKRAEVMRAVVEAAEAWRDADAVFDRADEERPPTMGERRALREAAQRLRDAVDALRSGGKGVG